MQRPAITKHLKNIFESGELHENSVSSILEHTAEDGKKYSTKFYNLDAIISVGYRISAKLTLTDCGQAGHEKMKIVDGVPEGWGKGFLEDIAAEGEADQTAICKDFLQVQKEGQRQLI